jgi:hypothetical protein
VVWDHLVTVVVPLSNGWRGFTIEFDPQIWQALEHGVQEMEAAPAQAVSGALPCRNQ